MQDKLEEQFANELLENAETAKRECGFVDARFMRMAQARGAVSAAKELIRKGGASNGFAAMQAAGRLELTVEASVVKAKYARLFTDDEVNACLEALCGCGYFKAK